MGPVKLLTAQNRTLDSHQGSARVSSFAKVAELVDALASGASGSNPVRVRVPLFVLRFGGEERAPSAFAAHEELRCGAPQPAAFAADVFSKTDRIVATINALPTVKKLLEKRRSRPYGD